MRELHSMQARSTRLPGIYGGPHERPEMRARPKCQATISGAVPGPRRTPAAARPCVRLNGAIEPHRLGRLARRQAEAFADRLVPKLAPATLERISQTPV